VPNSSPVHGEPAPGGGVGVGAWGPPDDGEGMRVDSVTDVAGAGDGARSGVGGLGSGQVDVRRRLGCQPEVHGVSARQGAHLAESWDVEMATVTASRPCPDQRADDDMPVHDADVHAADSGVPTGSASCRPGDESQPRPRHSLQNTFNTGHGTDARVAILRRLLLHTDQDAPPHPIHTLPHTRGRPLRKPRDEDEIRRRRQSKDARRNQGRCHAPP